MSIKLGNSNITLKVGSSAVTAAYLGSTQVYPQGEPPTPPVFDGKYKLTLSDSSVVSAACDGTSAITQDEISAYTSTANAVEIGDCVSEIGEQAFAYCSGLTSIYCYATTPPTLGSSVFDGSSCPIYVPCQSLSLYQQEWADYASRLACIP